MKKLYLRTSDVAKVLGISRRTAENMMIMFERYGWTIRLRPDVESSARLVNVRKLAGFLVEQDGGRVEDRVREIYECIGGN